MPYVRLTEYRRRCLAAFLFATPISLTFMKLHLPKVLRCALFSCFAAVTAFSSSMASEVLLSTVPEYNGSQGGSYAGVVFTLGTSTPERFTVTGDALPEQITLNAITLQERGGNYNFAEGRVLYITDANNIFLGLSDVYTKEEGSNDAVFSFSSNTITLNTADTYYAYIWDGNSSDSDSWVAGETAVPTGKFFSSQLAAAGGSLSADAAGNWGFLNGQKSLASTAYVPVMTISVSSASGEPVTPPASLPTYYWEGSSNSYWNSSSWTEEDGASAVNGLRPTANSKVVFSYNEGEPHAIVSNRPQNAAAADFIGGSYRFYETEGNDGHLTFSGDVSLLEGASLLLDVKLTAANVNMAEGTTLVLNDTVNISGKINIQGANTAISLAQNVTLAATRLNTTANGASLSLSGAGIYDLANANNLGSGVSLAETWGGTVKLTGSVLNGQSLDAFGNASSTVELCGVSGYLSTGSSVYESNLVLTNGENGVAFAIDNGNSGDTRTFNGSVSGEGTMKRSSYRGTKQTLIFNGDVSGWTGALVHAANSATSGSRKVETYVTFSGSSAINVSLSQTGQGEFHVTLDDSAMDSPATVTVSKDISATSLSVTEGTAVVLDGATTVTTLTGAADSSINANGALTLNGAGTVDSLTAGDLTLASTLEAGALALNGSLTLGDAASITADSLSSTGLDIALTLGTEKGSRDLITLAANASDIALTLNGQANGIISNDGTLRYDLQWNETGTVLSLVTSSTKNGYAGGDGSWADDTMWFGGETPAADGEAVFVTAADSSVSMGGAQTVGTLLVNTNADDLTQLNTTTLTDGSLTADSVSIESGKLVVADTATLEVSRLEGSSAAVLGGTVSVTGNGGYYKGTYDDATVRMLGGTQTLAPSAGLSITGTGGTAILAMDSAAVVTPQVATQYRDIQKIDTDNVNVVLDRPAGVALNLLEASSMHGGSLEIQMSPEELASGAAELITGETLRLDGTTVYVTTGVPADSMVLENAPDTLGYATIDPVGALDVQFDSAAFAKYYSDVVAEDGMLKLVRNNSYVTNAVQVTTNNGAAGAALLQDAFNTLNPQGNAAEYADLASALTAVDNGAVSDTAAAALAGASTAALGMAVSNDLERQMRAIRNRTTTMGVDQTVWNEDLPYLNAWINAEGDFAELDAENSSTSGYEMTSWGGTVGFDVDITPEFCAGLALTAMYGDYKVQGPDRAEGDVNTYYVSAFARYAASAWTHTFVMTAGLADTDIERTVQLGNASYTVQGDTTGFSFGAMYEVGRVIAMNEDASACFQPIFNVALRYVSMDGYAESGSDAALAVDSQDVTTVTAGLGARLQAVVGESVYNRSSILELRAMLKADAGDRSADSTVGLVNGNTTATVEGSESSVLGVELGAGLTIPMGLESGSIFMDVSAELRSGYTNANATVGYRINF